ncbi:MAG: hypothetical protein LUG45_05800 [Clostridiales bacterium]|nr:hypothetical protein [Clostridiales bacterium]
MPNMPKIFSRPSPEDAFVDKTVKKIRQRQEHAQTIAAYAAQLEECRLFFQHTVDSSRLNVLRRREARVSDAMEKERIHDAVIGLLAVEEAKLDLSSISSAKDMDYAMRNLEKILRQMYRMNAGSTSLTKKELRENMGMEFEDTMEPITFSSRAELVDERFVERVIQGYSIKECIEQTNVTGTGAADMGGINFEAPPDAKKITSDEEQILKNRAGRR